MSGPDKQWSDHSQMAEIAGASGGFSSGPATGLASLEYPDASAGWRDVQILCQVRAAAEHWDSTWDI